MNLLISNKSIERYFSSARYNLRRLSDALRSRGFYKEAGEVVGMFERLEFLEEYFKHESS